MKLQKWLCLALAVLLTAGLLPLTVMAAEEKTLLILGDSISTGFGLENYVAGEAPPAGAFPVLLTRAGGALAGYTPVYKARDGMKTGDILSLLQAEEDTEGYRAAVRKADVITMTIGGNDLMHLLYTTVTKVADPTPEETTEAEVQIIRKAMESGNMAVLTLAAAIINAGGFNPENPQMQTEIAAIAANIRAVIDALKDLNPKATIVVSTQYNPYERLAALLHGVQGVPLAQAIVKLSTDMDGTLAALSQTIVEGQMENGKQLYKVADVYTAFHGSETNLCNPALYLSPFGINLDFHPNAAGHKQIAKCFADAFTHTHTFTKVESEDKEAPAFEVCACGYTKKPVTKAAEAVE